MKALLIKKALRRSTFLSHPQANATSGHLPAVFELPTTCKMKFLVGLALCCAAIFVVSDATSAGAPIQACDNLTPGAPHGTTEQATPNPWMIDISSFDNGTGAYYYIPGYTYNGKMETIIEYSHTCTTVHTHSLYFNTHDHACAHVHTQSLFVESMIHLL